MTSHSRKTSAALLSVASNCVLIASKLAVGIASGSVSIISEALHSGVDLMASVIALMAVKVAARTPDEKHQYGYGKAEHLSSLIEAALIAVAAGVIIWEAAHRLLAGKPVEHLPLGIAVMLGSALINWIVSARLFRVARETRSAALEADAWHLRTDVWSSLGVCVGLAIVYVTGIVWLDAAIAIVVAIAIAREAWGLVAAAVADLFDISLPEDDLVVVKAAIESFSDKFVEFHDLRSRKSGGRRFLDVHIVLPQRMTVGEAHLLSDGIEAIIERDLPGTECLLHFEPCTVTENRCFACEASCERHKDIACQSRQPPAAEQALPAPAPILL